MNTHLANGDVSAYGFACGYVQAWTTDGAHNYYGTDANGVMLYHAGACFHVRTRIVGETHDDYGTAIRAYGARVDWQSFDTLTEARAAYRREITRVKRASRA